MIKKNIFLVFLVIVMGISLLGCGTDSIEGSFTSADVAVQEHESESSDKTSDASSTKSVDTVTQENGSENLDESESSNETSDTQSLSVKAKNLVNKAKNLADEAKNLVESTKSIELEENVDIEEPKDFTVSISVERTGNIVTNRLKLHVLIDGEEAFTVRGNSTEDANMILSKGTHTIQVKGQGDKSKKLEFNVTEDGPNYFYFWAEISNLWGIKFERRVIN